MEHVAIDLGGRKSQVCVRAADGEILEERQWFTSSLEKYLQKRPRSRVIVETSSEAFAVADGALRCGHEVRVVPATLVRSLGVGQRGIKTDIRDARVLSEVSCRIDLPSVHVSSERARELKAMCAAREVLVSSRTKLINNVRGWLRTQLIRIRTGGVVSFAQRVRDKLLKDEDGLPLYIERVLFMIEELTDQIRDATHDLEDVANNDEACVRLMSVPGVGPQTAVRFRAAIDDITRFANAHGLESYLGLTPGECSSSNKVHRTGLTKAGAKKVRWALVQAAWCAWRTRPGDPMVQWAQRVAIRRSRFVAVVALARKIAGILYAIWRDGSVYNPIKGARSIEVPEL